MLNIFTCLSEIKYYEALKLISLLGFSISVFWLSGCFFICTQLSTATSPVPLYWPAHLLQYLFCFPVGDSISEHLSSCFATLFNFTNLPLQIICTNGEWFLFTLALPTVADMLQQHTWHCWGKQCKASAQQQTGTNELECLWRTAHW